jgi:RNA polymerase sigma factor (sigma-70 family)
MLRRRDPLEHPEPLIRRVYSYAAYHLGDGVEAEDATSDTLVRAVRFRKSYDPREGTEQAWLLGIARRVVADHSRGRARAPAFQPGTALELDTSQVVLERIVVRDALAGLSPHERDLIALRYGADLAAKDIARILGERTNTVEVALHRVLLKLRARLGAESSVEAEADS